MTKVEEALPLFTRQTQNYGDTPPLDHVKKNEKTLWSTITFSWMQSLFQLTKSHHIDVNDLPPLQEDQNSATIVEQLSEQWKCERKGKIQGSLLSALLRAFGIRFAISGMLRLIYLISTFVGPIMIHTLTRSIVSRSTTLGTVEGLTYAVIFIIFGLLSALARAQSVYHTTRTASHVRTAISALTIQHLMIVSPGSIQKRCLSRPIVDLVEVDAQTVFEAIVSFQQLWTTPLHIAITLLFLWTQVGIAAIASIMLIIASVPCTALISAISRRYHQPLVQAREECFRACHEFFTSIEGMKMQGWESAVIEHVMPSRNEELRWLKVFMWLQVVVSHVFAVVLVPIIIAVVTLWLHCRIFYNTLEISTTLTTLALLHMIYPTITSFPSLWYVVYYNGRASLENLTEFLNENERIKAGYGNLAEVGIEMINAGFKWDVSESLVPTTKEEEKLEEIMQDVVSSPHDIYQPPILYNLTFSAKAGELYCVAGPAGIGKSTFLAGIIGQARCCVGELAVRGSVAFVSCDQPFIVEEWSLQENVCMTRKVDVGRYQESLRVCGFTDELPTMAKLNRSQRIRVSLARALYHDAEIYLLDDIFTVMDEELSTFVMKQCIRKSLRHKLVILATNSSRFIKECDQVLVLGEGTIVEEGTWKKLKNKKGGYLSAMFASGEIKDLVSATNENSSSQELQDEEGKTHTQKRTNEDSILASSVNTSYTVRVEPSEEDERQDIEEMSVMSTMADNVDRKILRWWIRKCGGIVCLLVVALYVTTEVSTLESFVSLATSLGVADENHAKLKWFLTYSMLSVVSSVLATSILLLVTIHASSKVFDELIRHLASAPMAFFATRSTLYSSEENNNPNQGLTTLLDGILSYDVTMMMDDALFKSIHVVMFSVLKLLISFSLMMSFSPLISMSFLFPLCACIVIVQRSYLSTIQDLERLQKTTQTVVMEETTLIVDGMMTIRMYQAESMFNDRMNKRLDDPLRVSEASIALQYWVGLRLHAIGVMLVAVALVASLQVHHSKSNINIVNGIVAIEAEKLASSVGIALLYALFSFDVLDRLTHVSSSMQEQTNALQRLKAYTTMASEGESSRMSRLVPAQEWPHAGEINFQNVSLRYRVGLPRVFRGLTFVIQAGEKVGIVGKSGAGKSTIIAALLRIVELNGGMITIDGIDISQLSIQQLRSKITVIPHDPVFLSGTIRQNLDPNNQYTDQELWTVVKQAQLSELIPSLDNLVDYQGQNFTMEDRHLFSIARALLKRSRIVLMDETSMDTEIYRYVQQTLEQTMPRATMLMMSRNMNTMIHVDHILVMDKGRIIHHISPEQVQQKSTKGPSFKTLISHFRTGKKES